MKLNPCYSILPVVLLAACGVAAGNPDRPQKLHIDKRYPPAATSGTPLTLQGRNFGAAQGIVNIGGKSAEIISWSKDEVVVKTPSDATTACASARVVSADGKTSNAVPFAYGDGGLWIPNNEVPLAREGAVSVWTGEEMLVWGGGTNTGGRYNPLTDSWLPMTTVGAPLRSGGQAFWTGKVMLVWGGHFGSGRYDPVEDTWAPVSREGIPNSDGAAVWTGKEMIVWAFSGGARYDPVANQWQAMSAEVPGKPALTKNLPRISHSSVWTGSVMIIWGGLGRTGHLNDGAMYRPSNDTWEAIAPSEGIPARAYHNAVWTGEEMLIWGGTDFDQSGIIDQSELPTPQVVELPGARYNPRTNTWRPMSTLGAPRGVLNAVSMWDGERWLIFGGLANDMAQTPVEGGVRYNPGTDQWTPLPTKGQPERRARATAIWTGSDMLMWGGMGAESSPVGSGARYNPRLDQWAPIAGVVDQPSARTGFSFHWTGTEVLVWGGSPDSTFLSLAAAKGGSRYNPATNQWLHMSNAHAPRNRFWHTSVWTGSQMIVWGGALDFGSTNPDSGEYRKEASAPVAYRPATDEWSTLSSTNAPSHQLLVNSVWTGEKMIVWSGMYDETGGMYEPATDKWYPMSTTGAPQNRFFANLVWTGSEVLVYGGGRLTVPDPSSTQDPWEIGLSSGGRYNPATDQWAPIPTAEFLDIRSDNTAFWTGTEYVVIGSHQTQGRTIIDTNFEAQGGRYDPKTNQWTPLNLKGAPIGRFAEAIWTGQEILVFSPPQDSGSSIGGVLPKGFRYSLAQDTWSTIRCGCNAFNMDSGFVVSAPQRAVWTGASAQIWGLFGAVTYMP